MERSAAQNRAGHPFVGPAGTLLRNAMSQAGKKRIHQKPKTIEIQACEPWLEAEIRKVRPQVVVALGATAAQALLGNKFRLTKHRCEVQSSPLAPRLLATVQVAAML